MTQTRSYGKNIEIGEYFVPTIKLLKVRASSQDIGTFIYGTSIAFSVSPSSRHNAVVQEATIMHIPLSDIAMVNNSVLGKLTFVTGIDNMTVRAKGGTTKIRDVVLSATSELDIKTYTKSSFLGQAIKDNVLAPTDVIVTVSGLTDSDFDWSLGNIGGTQKASKGVLKLTKGDLEFTNAVDGDPLIINIAGKEIKIATYKPGEIRVWQDLQAMRQDLGGTYTLMHDIVFPDVDNNDIGDYNFVPIGSNVTKDKRTRFTGDFVGNGYTIDKLYVNHGAKDYIGLFGYIAQNSKINRVRLTHVEVSGNDYVGGFTGYSEGVIDGEYVIGRITGIGSFVGAFVGYNCGFINGHARGHVLGLEAVGGLVGLNYDGMVYGHTTVSLLGKKNTGGLTGINSGSISGYAKGSVSGGENTGGLVGSNIGLVDGYARANVFGGKNVGGFVGLNDGYTRGYATGNVQGSGTGVGGLVGRNTPLGVVIGYATGSVSCGAMGIGGLVGINGGRVIGYATGWLRGGTDVGGLVGYNKGSAIGYATGSITGVGDVGGFVGTTFGVAVGYATGHVIGGVYVGGFVGSNFSSSITVGYWDMVSTSQHSSAGGDQVIGISDVKNIIFESDINDKYVESDKYNDNPTPVLTNPLFVSFFEPSTVKGKWPKLRKVITLNGKSYNFVYSQSP